MFQIFPSTQTEQNLGHFSCITVIDDDIVDLSNLQRQVIHKESWVGRSKAESAEAFIHELNSDVQVVVASKRLTGQNIQNFIKDKDVVIDCSDNFVTRYMISDACTLLGVPCVWGSVLQFQGQVSVFSPPKSPCYRCLYPSPPPPDLAPSCATAGVFGALCGIIGAAQAAEVIKVITGIGDPLYGKLWTIDIGSFHSNLLKFKKKVSCQLCGPDADIHSVEEIPEQSCIISASEIAVGEFEHFRKQKAETKFVEIIDVREPFEWDICSIPGVKFVPLSEVSAYLKSSKACEFIFVCKTGFRAAQAANIALGMHLEAKVLKGGILEWEQMVNNRVFNY